MLDLIRKNASRLDFPPNITAHPVVHVEHMSRAQKQPTDISQPITTRRSPFPQADATTLIYVDKILRHRKRGAGYQWIAAKTGAPLDEEEWKQTKDFVDKDGTINEAFHKYICDHTILPDLHNIVVDDNKDRKQW